MQNGMISQFITEELFNRSSNFSGRYVLWKTALGMIAKHPWIGYGRWAQDYIAAWGGYYSSHNYILELMLQGGIAATGQFLLLLIMSIKKCLLSRESKISNCLLFALLSILIAVLMEAEVHSVYIFGIIILCYSFRNPEWEAEN